MSESLLRLLILSCLLATSLLNASAQQNVIQIHADLTDAPRNIYHADVDLSVRRGPLDLITPEWIPGTHGPEGPILDITGVRFEVDSKPLPWHRDPVNTYEYHLEIPAGASMLHAHLDCINTRASRTSATLEWEDLLLYPAHVPVREIAVQPTVIVPAHWGIGTSLKPLTPYDPQDPAGGKVQYAPTTVEMLEDSPVVTGLYFHEYALAPDVSPKHFMDVIGQGAARSHATSETADRGELERTEPNSEGARRSECKARRCAVGCVLCVKSIDASSPARRRSQSRSDRRAREKEGPRKDPPRSRHPSPAIASRITNAS